MKAIGGAVGIAAVGSKVGGHNKFATGTDGYLGDNIANSEVRTERVAYHTAGGVGPRSVSGEPEDAHQGAMTEFRVHDDLAFVTMFTSRSESSQVGLAIFDISQFTRSDTKDDLRDAELNLLSFVRNDNNLAAPIDCKVSDDGNYVFICKQPLSALFGEAEGVEPNTDNHGFSPGAASLDAVDVSDPGNPEVTDSVNISRWALGPHNCWYHQIDGDGYVFTTHGADGVTGSVNIFQFDHDTGQLQQVNNWTWPGQDEATVQGETEAFDTYAHDIVIQEDPRYGIPIAYVSYIDAGTRILDVSNPLDIRELGVFEMEISHHSVPTAALIADGNGNEKRLMVCGQEQPDDDQGLTGYIHLVDVDPIDAVIEGERDPVYLGCSRWVREKETGPREKPAFQMYDDDDVANEGPLDEWALIEPDEDGFGSASWAEAPGFEDEAAAAAEDPGGDDEDSPGEYDGFSAFRISTHNLDADTEGNVYLGHYHAGSRFFEIVGPGGQFPEGPDTEGANVLGETAEEVSVDLDWRDLPDGAGEGTTNDSDRWFLVETGYNRVGLDIPEESAFIGPGEIDDGLTASTPFHWCLVERNGAAFAGGINGGPQVFAHDDIEVGNDKPLDVTVERDHDSSVVTAGQVHRVTITADADEPVVVRDAVPPEWTVLEDASPDVSGTDDCMEYRTMVRLELDENGEAAYLLEAPDEFGRFTFGPVEYARADEGGEPEVDSPFGGGNSTTNRLWRKENTTTLTVNVAGLDTSV